MNAISTPRVQSLIPNTQNPPRNTRHRELVAAVAVLLIAASLRLIALDAVPPGLHHDEVIIGQVAKDILRGRLAIYFPEGYGHEPLYHYILAGMFAVGGANEFTLRLTTALLGILTVAVVYRMTRSMFGAGVALMSAAWMAVLLWPVFYSRIGLRNITLPLMISLTTWLLWSNLKSQISTPRKNGGQALKSPRFASYLKWTMAGVSFGLTFYTYQGSRVFPFVFLLWAMYLAVFQRTMFVRIWKGLLVFAVVAALVAAPLAYYLLFVNPQAEARVVNLMGPLSALRTGDPSQVIQLAAATAGMFTVRGDGVWLYNVSGRPVFPEPLSSVLFYAGLLLALWRWRKPQYALMLIWLPISLGPAAVSWPAPNFVRALGALPVTFIFPALAWAELQSLISNKWRKAGYWVLGIVLATNGIWTARDYFDIWPRNLQVRWLYQATWTQAARWLDASPDATSVAVSGLKIHDLDPRTFDLLMRRRDVKVKWFDCRTSILLPGNGAMRYISPDFFPCDADLWSRFLGDAHVIAQPHWPDTGDIIFTGTIVLNGHPLGQNPSSSSLGPLLLQKSEISRPLVARGDEAEILTFWKVADRVPVPTTIFVHIAGKDGQPIAQWDGFDFGEAQLESGDQLIERHRFKIPPEVASGNYLVIVGVYNPAMNKRFTLPNGDDHIVLGHITITAP